MVILRKQKIREMNEKEKAEKIIELKLELAKSGIQQGKGKAKAKEIKKTIARILTK